MDGVTGNAGCIPAHEVQFQAVAPQELVSMLVAYIHRDLWHDCRGVHRVTDLEKNPVRVSKDEALTPLPLFGLVI